MDSFERAVLIYRQIKNGMTVDQLASTLGISSEQVEMWLAECPAALMQCREIAKGNVPGQNMADNTNLSYRYGLYKTGAKQRNIPFEISVQEFHQIVQLDCFYCGSSPAMITHRSKKYDPYVHNGIDRLDSGLGYTWDNSIPCCLVCNKMKLNYDVEFFLRHLQKIAHHWKDCF